MKIKDIKKGMKVETTAGIGIVERVGGTHPPAVFVTIVEPFPLGNRALRPRDVLRVIEDVKS